MSEAEGDTLPYPILPAHLFFRYDVRGDTLFLGFIPDDDWETHLSSNDESFILQDSGSDPDGISDWEDLLILPQKTKELQALVTEIWDAWASEEEEEYFIRDG